MRLLYYVSDEITKTSEHVPFWYDQLGPFDKTHILSHGKEFEPFIACEAVHCEPLRDILARNRIRKIDLLHIDTEGYDYEVLKQVDLESPPRVILYEHKHLSSLGGTSPPPDACFRQLGVVYAPSRGAILSRSIKLARMY